MLIKKALDIRSSEITPKSVYLRRREFIQASAAALVAAGLPSIACDAAAQVGGGLAKLPNVKSESCKSLYRVFLESPGPRAYAVSPDGRCGFAGSVRNANELALRQCRRASANGECSLYAVDGEVVWKPELPPVIQATSNQPSATASTGSTDEKK